MTFPVSDYKLGKTEAALRHLYHVNSLSLVGWLEDVDTVASNLLPVVRNWCCVIGRLKTDHCSQYDHFKHGLKFQGFRESFMRS